MEIQHQIEILEKLKENLIIEDNKGTPLFKGMCAQLRVMFIMEIIKDDEEKETLKFLRDNIPTYDNQFKEFTESILWKNPQSKHEFWWETKTFYPDGLKIRIAFVTALINQYSK